MNSKIIGVIVAVIILLALGGYFIFGKNKAPEKMAQTSQTPAKTSASATNTTLAGLLAMGQNQRCTFSTNSTTGGTTNGTFYVSKGNVRGDMTMKASNGKEDQMSIIRMGDTNYIWGSALPTGIKMTLSLDKITQGANANASQYSSINQKADFNCVPWSVDSSLFTPPANVKFTDMTSMMPNSVSPGGTQVTPSGKGYLCDGITDPSAKAACENSMHGSGY